MKRVALVLLLGSLPLAACGGALELPSDAPDGGADAAVDTGDTGAADAASDALPDVPLCAASDCGPMSGAPMERCWDGSYGGNTGRCIRVADRCQWEYRACPPPKPCTATAACGAATLFCKVDPGKCGGSGLCALRPEGCPTIYAPVCGCDGKTYGNECEAQSAGVTVATLGACKPTGSSCGGAAGTPCAKGEMCKWAIGACLSAGPVPPTGTCVKLPMGCPDVWAPVCGCDGKTYGNECDATSASANVASEGECATSPDLSCGGFAGTVCPSTMWCDYPTGSYCGGDDSMGTCKARPSGCTKEWNPVCGCDGKTYSNACMANAAGQDVSGLGACK